MTHVLRGKVGGISMNSHTRFTRYSWVHVEMYYT